MFQAIAKTGLHFTIGFQTPRLSLIHVDDMVDALIAAADRGERLDHHADGDDSPAGYYLTCDDREHPTYWQFGQLVAHALDRRVLVWPLWRWVGKTVGFAAQTLFTPDGKGNLLSVDKVREATAWSWACSSAKARADLGLAPRKPLQARLRDTAASRRPGVSARTTVDGSSFVCRRATPAMKCFNATAAGSLPCVLDPSVHARLPHHPLRPRRSDSSGKTRIASEGSPV